MLALNYQWADLLQNAVCKNGQTLAEVGSPDYTAEYVDVYCQVGGPLLENMCPPASCPTYNAVLNTYMSQGLCELYPEMVKIQCGEKSECVSNEGSFLCHCVSGYDHFLPNVGCTEKLKGPPDNLTID